MHEDYQHNSAGEVGGCKHDKSNDLDLKEKEWYIEYDDIEAAMEEDRKMDNEDEDIEDGAVCEENPALTSQQMDLIATYLGGNWKRFSRISKLIHEAEIENIDERYNSLYEKAYQMLILWGRKSPLIITLSMVNMILVSMERNDLVRLLGGEPSTFSHSMGNLSSTDSVWDWKKFDRQSSDLSEVEIQNLNADERLLFQLRRNSYLSCSSIDYIYPDMKNEFEERVIRYKVNNRNDVRKIKAHLHRGLEDIVQALLVMDSRLTLVKVQYIDRQDGQTITCDCEAHLDLAIFEENITDFNVIAKRKWWDFFQPSTTNVRTLT